MQDARGSGFAALPQHDAVSPDESTNSVYDVDARDHTERSLDPSVYRQQSTRQSPPGQVGTALSPIHEGDAETLRGTLYDPAEAGTGCTNYEFYGPDDLGRNHTVQTAYHGADYDEWDEAYKTAEGGYLAPTKRSPNYKPCAFRLWFLAIVLFIVLALLTLVELGVANLPDGTKSVAPQHTFDNGTELRPREDNGYMLPLENLKFSKRGDLLFVVRQTASQESDTIQEAAIQEATTSAASTTVSLKSTSTNSEAGTTTLPTAATVTTSSTVSSSESDQVEAATAQTISSTSSGSMVQTTTVSEKDTSVTSTSSAKSITPTITPTTSISATSTSSEKSLSTTSTLTSLITSTSSFKASVVTTTRNSTTTDGRITCTVTLYDEPEETETEDPEPTVTLTKTVSELTVTIRNGTTANPPQPTKTTTTKKTKTSKTATPTNTESCDVIVTITVPAFPQPSSSAATSAATTTATGVGQPYITIGLNTVTVIDDSPETAPTPIVVPVDPTSTCYFKTETVTEESNGFVTTVTLTVDVVVQAGALVRREQATPLPIYEKRACVEGGIFTVTQHIAKPATVTKTVFRTITKNREQSILVEPETTTTRVTTDNAGNVVSTVETKPAVTTTKQGDPPSGAATTIKVTSTKDNGQVVTNTVVGLLTTQGLTTIVSTAVVPVTTTDKNGNVVTSSKTSVVTKTGLSGSTTVLTTTDKNGNIVVTTSTAKPKEELGTMLTMMGTTLTNSEGKPTLTTSELIYVSPVTTTRTNSAGVPTTTETFLVLNGPETTTLSDAEGKPSSTATYYLLTSSTVLTDTNGRPTATSVVTRTMTLSLTTEMNDRGAPTATETVLASASFSNAPLNKPTDPPKPIENFQVYSITAGEYLTGLIIPTLLATILTLPIRILDHVAKLYHPFHILASSPHATGATAAHSIAFETIGPWTFITRFQQFLSGEVFLAITGTLVLLSAILVPISAETMRIILHGPNCKAGSGTAANCAMTLGAFPVWAHLAAGILGLMAVLLIITMLLLWRNHRTGVQSRPWSLASMAAMSANPEFQTKLSQMKSLEDSRGEVSNSKATDILSGSGYTLAYRQDGAMSKYEVVPIDDGRKGGMHHPSLQPGTTPGGGHKAIPFYALTLWGRVVILIVLLGMLALIISSRLVKRNSSALGEWMASETVGLRIFVVSVGMIITLFWSSYFYCVAFMTPYKILHHTPSRSRDALNLPLSTNPFSGLFRSLNKPKGTHDWFLASVAAVALLSEFLPALLSNVPYKVIQTSETHAACVYLSASILGLMIMVTCGSFFVDWPNMPVDPSTCVGAMYYLSAARGGDLGGGGIAQQDEKEDEADVLFDHGADHNTVRMVGSGVGDGEEGRYAQPTSVPYIPPPSEERDIAGGGAYGSFGGGQYYDAAEQDVQQQHLVQPGHPRTTSEEQIQQVQEMYRYDASR